MKISTARLKQIIKEELFYREFHRKTDELTEVHSEKQRDYMCAMKDSNDRPEGLSKAEAEEMCTGPMKEDALKEGFAVSKQDLVNVGLPLGAVRGGLYDRVIARLARVGRNRGIPALQSAIRNLGSYELSNPAAVIAALEREL